MWCDIWTICRCTAGGAGELSHAAPSCARCGKIMSEATLTAQKVHHGHRAHDKEYLILPESWGEIPSSWDHAHYCWADTQKWGIRQRRGLCGVAHSLHQMQVPETNCIHLLPDKIWWEIAFLPRMADGGKYGCTSIIFTRIWQLLIVSL